MQMRFADDVRKSVGASSHVESLILAGFRESPELGDEWSGNSEANSAAGESGGCRSYT